LIYRFANFALDTELLELRSARALVRVEPQVFSLLVYLIENRSHVVSKEALIEAVWDGRIVSDDTLNSRINAARRAVGDTGTAQAVIRTFARRGFRFVAEIDVPASLPPGRGPSANDLPASAGPEVSPHRQEAPLPLPDRPLIAVLAFANLSGDTEQEYFSDGITEDIITELSRFSELFVIARNSSFQYKGKTVDVRQVGRELGVRYVLEGSVRRGGDRLRISAQLIDAMTGGHRWAEHYDRKLEDVFAVQDEVAHTVAALLAAHVSKAEAERTLLKPPAAWQAYDYFMRAADTYASFHRHFQVAAVYETRRFLDQCLAIDLDFARAYILQSATQTSTYVLPLDADHLNPAAIDAAHRSADKAVQLDGNLPQAHAQLGYVLSFKGESEPAVAEFERAIALHSNFTDWRFPWVLVTAGHPERAIDVAKAHLRLDPFAVPIARGFLGLAYYMLQRYPEAVAPIREFVSRSPNHVPGRVWLTATYAQLGRLEQARAEAAELLRIAPGWTLSGRMMKAMAHRYQRAEDFEHLADALRKAGLPE